MTPRRTQDDLTQRVDQLQARLAAVEQASGAAAPERTTRRDMFRRAGITAAGVVGGAAGLSLLNAQQAHAATGDPDPYVQLGTNNIVSGTGAQTTAITTTGAGSVAFAAYGGTTGAIGSGDVGLKGVSSASGNGATGVLGNAGSGYGVRGTARSSGAGVLGQATGNGLGILGMVNTAGSSGVGVVGVGAFAGVIGSGQVPSGTGSGAAAAPDLAGYGSGRIAQKSEAGPPGFGSLSGTIGEQTRDSDGVLWLSDGDGGWAPASLGGLDIALFNKQITTQPVLSNSDGSTWKQIDPGLTLTLTPTFNCQAVIRLTGAAFTASPMYNQDLGIAVGSAAYSASGSTTTPASWTEAGAPTVFSPNGFCAEAIVPMAADTTYYVTAVWKANAAPGSGGRSSSSTIFLGAGPLADGSYSPTRLLTRLVVDSAASVVARAQGKSPAKAQMRPGTAKNRHAWTPAADRKMAARHAATNRPTPRNTTKTKKQTNTKV